MRHLCGRASLGHGVDGQAHVAVPGIQGLVGPFIQPALDEAVRVALVGGPQDGEYFRVLADDGLQVTPGLLLIEGALLGQGVNWQIAFVIIAEYLLLSRGVEEDGIVGTSHGRYVAGQATIVVTSVLGIAVVIEQRLARSKKRERYQQKHHHSGRRLTEL